GEFIDRVAGHLEATGADQHFRTVVRRLNRDVAVLAFAENLRELMDGEDGFTGLLDLDAAQFVADADLGVEGDESEAVVRGDGLYIAEDRFGGAGRDRGGD